VNSYSVHFKFSQHFDFPPERAYRWCTEYEPGDIVLQGKSGVRKVQWVNEDTALLTDFEFVGSRKVAGLFAQRKSLERVSSPTNSR
jgi:hypothetical protein